MAENDRIPGEACAKWFQKGPWIAEARRVGCPARRDRCLTGGNVESRQQRPSDPSAQTTCFVAGLLVERTFQLADQAMHGLRVGPACDRDCDCVDRFD